MTSLAASPFCLPLSRRNNDFSVNSSPNLSSSINHASATTSREQNTNKSTQKSNKMSEADQEWKPSGRPTSTMAQAFSASLDSAFSLDSDVSHLSQTIDQKRQQMMIQNRELEELQQRIREAEERLKARESGAVEGTSKNTGQRDGESRSTGNPFSASRRLFGRDEQRGPQGTTTNSS